MNDRELLEAAAKAAGVAVEWDGSTQQPVMLDEEGLRIGWWNPLMSDGTAFRLAVKLGVEIGNYHQYGRALAFIGSRRGSGEYWETGDDPAAATRRAIVRAAAAMAG